MKKAIRKRVLRLRREFGGISAHVASQRVCERLQMMNLPSPIAVYLAADGEVDVDNFILAAIRSGKKVLSPRWNGAGYELCELKSLSPNHLTLGPHGIREPASGDIVRPEAIASWVIPGVAFTCDLCRLGYGGGWYDRLLSGARPDARKIGVGYDFQIVESLPQDEHDVKMTDVVYPETIIDVHSHNFPDRLAQRAVDSLCRKTESFLWPAADGTMENHLDHLEAAGVDMAVLCQVSTRPGQSEAFLRTAEAIMSGRMGERARRRLIPFGSIHPADPDAVKHLKAFAAAGVKGVKLHPYYQSFSLADSSLWPLFGKIADLGLTVECHAGDDLGYPGTTGVAGPGEIAKLLRNVPGLKFIAAHLGGCEGSPAHATDEIRDLGCYIDTSALHKDWHKDEQVRILRTWPRDRIMFATDFPWVYYPEAIRWVRSVREREDWQLVFSKNAKRLMGLEVT